jgi:hypothetical protein
MIRNYCMTSIDDHNDEGWMRPDEDVNIQNPLST